MAQQVSAQLSLLLGGIDDHTVVVDAKGGEEHGVDYFFVTKEQFEDMIHKEELVEYAQYVSNYYGTPKAYVEEQLTAGKSVILEIEIQGALKIKEQFPDTLLLFVTAPSAEELKNRLTGRGTETQEVIAARLSRAVEESQGMEEYDYLVVNDKVDETVELVDTIIEGLKNQNTEGFSNLSLSSNINFVNKLREELSGFSKGE